MERKWWTLLAVCIAIFMLLLDVTIVNVALPSIERSLGADFTDLQWVIDAYALTLAGVLLTAGSLADMVGRRLVFMLGLAIFTAASLACGLAPDPLFLHVSRAVQGIGGAMMFGTSLALIAQEFHGRERGTALGAGARRRAWRSRSGRSSAARSRTRCRLALDFPRQRPDRHRRARACADAKFASRATRPPPVSTSGRALPSPPRCSCSSTGSYAATTGAGGSAKTVAMLAGAVVLLVAFFAIERYVEHPMLDLSLFSKPTFTGASIVAFSLSSSIFAMFLYLTLYIQNDPRLRDRCEQVCASYRRRS